MTLPVGSDDWIAPPPTLAADAPVDEASLARLSLAEREAQLEVRRRVRDEKRREREVMYSAWDTTR